MEPNFTYRSFQVDTSSINEAERTVEMSVTSDNKNILARVKGHGIGYEVLDHSDPRNVDLSRFAGNGGPMLYDHKTEKLIGKFKPTGFSSGKLRGIGKFGTDEDGELAWQKVKTGSLDQTSAFFFYDPADVVENKNAHRDYPEYHVKKWGLIEASMVPIPADISIGVGRSGDPKPYGDVKYADPADGKYPIDTVVHIKSAWDYIHVAKNAEELGDKLPSVKAHIIAAWKEKIDKDGPPEADKRALDITPDKLNITPDPNETISVGTLGTNLDGDDLNPINDLNTGADGDLTAPPRSKRSDCVDPNCTNDSLCADCRCDDMRSAAAEPAKTLAVAGRSRKESHMDPILEGATEPALDLTSALQLRSVAEMHGKAREADEIFSAGKSATETRKLILGLIASKPVDTQSLEAMGASKRELEAFRYSNLILASADQAEGRRSSNCMELEISDTIAKTMPSSYKSRNGLFLPYALGKRAGADAGTLATNAAGSGAEAVFTVPGELIEALRNSLKIAGLGAHYLTGLSSPVGFVKQTGISKAYWVSENSGTDVAESDLTTGLATLTPKTLQGTSSFSRQLLVEASYPVESMVRFDLGYAHAAAIDYAAMFGTGSANGQPMGLYNLTGTGNTPNTVAFSGGKATYALLTEMVALVAAKNALMANPGFITTTQNAADMLTTLEFNVNGSKKLWEGNIESGQVCGYSAVSSNQVLSNLGTGVNEHGTIFGAWSQCVIGAFGGGFEVITDPYRLKKQGIIEVTSFSMHDLIFRHPESFTISTGLVA